jgi:predicted ArsR family transcriptional regulator
VAESGIPAEVERFIASHIKSIEQLEVLLLLSSAPEKNWSVASVYQVIRSSESSVRERLDELVAQGLVQTSAASATVYKFSPKDKAASDLVAELASAYKERRVKVVQTIYSPPAIPTAAEEFANAFKIRKEK